MGYLPHIQIEWLAWRMRRFWVPPVCNLRVEWGAGFLEDQGRDVRWPRTAGLIGRDCPGMCEPVSI